MASELAQHKQIFLADKAGIVINIADKHAYALANPLPNYQAKVKNSAH